MDYLSAIYPFCNYQERSHYEVRNKLYDLGANTKEVEETIATLIEKDLINEERFARAIARGKFRLKQWGRIKIKVQLKQHKISDYCIRKAMSEIDPEEYEATILKLTVKKWVAYKGVKNAVHRRMKVVRYLMQKGFETDLANNAILKLIEEGNIN